MPVEHVNAKTYAEFVGGPGVALVHFWAEWDSRHLAARLQIEAAVDAVGGDVRVAMFDVDDPASSSIPRRLGVANLPTVLCFRDGDLVARQVGLWPSDVIGGTLCRIRAETSYGRLM